MGKIGLTDKEKAFQADNVWPHIRHVQLFIMRMIEELHVRMFNHDVSKLSRPEIKEFSEHVGKLHEYEPGTLPHARALKGMNKAMEIHYTNNRHHPEHHENGVSDMTLIDLLQMLCDWKAVAIGGEMSMEGFLEDARQRFNLSSQTYDLLANTIKQHLGGE